MREKKQAKKKTGDGVGPWRNVGNTSPALHRGVFLDPPL